MNSSPSHLTIDPTGRFLEAWEIVRPIAGQLDERVSSAVDACRNRVDLGLFRLVVVGEIKKGKSSFLNGLLSDPTLLPTDTDIATSTVFKILYGPVKKYKAFFLPDPDTGHRSPTQEISSDQVADFGTESGNPGNVKRVDFIGIELPHALLKEGLVLVDTPGLGGVYRAHREITWRYAPQADAICFVVDSVEAVISSDEIQFVKDLRQRARNRVFFVQTKTDAVSEEQRRAWQARNLEILGKELGEDAKSFLYFPVSSKLKLLAESRQSGRHLSNSGYLQVNDFLQHGLMSVKRREIANAAAENLLTIVNDAGVLLQQQRQIFGIESAPEIEQLNEQYTEVRREFEKWRASTLQTELKTHSQSVHAARQRSSLELQDGLDPAGPIIGNILRRLRLNNMSASRLDRVIGEIQADCVATCGEYFEQIQMDLRNAVTTITSESLGRLAVGFKLPALAEAAVKSQLVDASRMEQSLNLRSRTFENARAVWGGGAFGFGVSSTVAGMGLTLCPSAAAAALAFPPLGIAILAGIGLATVWGVGSAVSDVNSRGRDEAISKTTQMLQNLSRQIQRNASHLLVEYGEQLESASRGILNEAAESHQRRLTERIAEIDSRRKLSRDQILSRVKDIDAQIKQLQNSREILQGIVQPATNKSIT